MKTSRFILACFAFGAIFTGSPYPLNAADKPNIVFILIDDMPWYGTPVRMDADMPGSAMAFRNLPNVEKLAAQGMTFRNARAAAGMTAEQRAALERARDQIKPEKARLHDEYNIARMGRMICG